jgi:hypothetical protein
MKRWPSSLLDGEKFCAPRGFHVTGPTAR